jgi:site-specific DNA-methyltransferase (adenine-specific)
VSNNVQITQSDALGWMESLQDESAHVVITDPPYWTLDKWRNQGTTARLGGHSDKDSQRDEMFFRTVDQKYLRRIFLEIDRVLTLDGHAYIFCDDIVAPILLNWIREAKDEHRFGEAHLLIWDKVNQGMGYHYRRRYECIVFAWREKREGVRGFEKRRLADLGIPDILTHKRVVNGYPTEKPVALVGQLVSQSLRPGECIIDPFAGSGVLAAAVPESLNARILMNDISGASMEYIRKRFASTQEKVFAPPVENKVLVFRTKDEKVAPLSDEGKPGASLSFHFDSTPA